jgi:hypothetical protein
MADTARHAPSRWLRRRFTVADYRGLNGASICSPVIFGGWKLRLFIANGGKSAEASRGSGDEIRTRGRRTGVTGQARCLDTMDLIMTAYKSPDFNERAAAARAAKQKALEQLRSKPAPDPAVVAARLAAQAAREAAAAEQRAARQAEKEAAKAAKAAAAEAAGAKEAAAAPLTEAELKAARDARYAARKARKR